MIFALGVTALVLVTVLEGMHLAGPAIVTPMLRSTDAAGYIRLKQVADTVAPRLAKPLMLSALASTGIATVLVVIDGRAAAGALFGVALMALVGTLAAIIAGDLPINRAMATWEPESPPPDWHDVRARWERYFLLRVVGNTIAVVAAAIAVFLLASD